MKRTYLITMITTVLLSLHLSSQERVQYLKSFDKKPFRYGFYLGVNNNDMKFSYSKKALNNLKLNPSQSNIYVKSKTGFNVGLVADFRILDNINIVFEPGLMTNSKEIYNYLGSRKDTVREISSTYLHLPLLVKLSTNRWHNVRPFIIGGASYNYNFSSNQDNPDDNSAGVFRTKSSTYMWEIGMGVDMYFWFFRFSPSIRGVFAFNNELVRDNDPNSTWTAPIDYLGTRGVFLHLAFE